MSCGEEQLLDNTKNFELLYSINIDGSIPFYAYRSKNTGITVCIAETHGPFINGDVNIVTETFDNDGLPYAVEHLIFMASDDYRYNNILQLWGSRFLTDNIKGFAFKTHTCFTMRAAGSEAFLTLMPTYLDHILYPTLEDTAYRVEVHDSTRKGHNAGTVYCKTQATERTANFVLHNKMLRVLYPGKCGYKSVIPGTTKNLRESTNNEKVKQFHRKFYRPENLTILITGKITHSHIFQALLPLEQKIMSKKRNDIFERPWQNPIESFKKSAEVEVIFPSEDANYGEVHVAWRGPSAITQVYEYTTCQALLEYIAETNDSPLRLFFDKFADQCSITWFSSKWSVSYLKIIFENVPLNHIDSITKESMYTVLKTVYTNGINMKIMESLIRKSLINYRNEFELTPHEPISHILFHYLVYENIENLQQRLQNILREKENLLNKPKEHFLDLLKQYFIDAPMVIVKGEPSFEEYYKLQKKEKHVTEQITKFGRKSLKEKDKELQQAIEKLNKGVLKEVGEKMLRPGIETITFHDIQRYNTQTLEQHPKFDVKRLPFFTYLDHVNTNFFYLQVIMDTSSISLENKLYILLLAEVLLESPVNRENQLISNEKLKDLLLADNIVVHSPCGIDFSHEIAHTLSLMIRVELQNYEKSVQCCKEFLYHTIITVESLKIALTRLLDKNTENYVQIEIFAMTLLDTLLYTDGNFQVIYSPFWQYKFFYDVKQRLDTDVGQKEVLAHIESVRQALTSPKNMFMYMGVNVDKLTEHVPDVYAPWTKYFADFMNFEKTKINITSKSNFRTSSPSFTYNGYIMEIVETDTTVLIQSCPCINDLQHSDLPALEVCLTYLTQEEGPLWEVQQALDAFNLFTTMDDGTLTLKLVSTTNVVAAYNKIKSIVNAHGAKNKWNYYFYERAKSSAISKYINMVDSIKNVMNASVTSYCKNMPHDYIYQMVQSVYAVSIDDMSRVTTRYIKPLFDPKNCKIAIVCNTEERAEIIEAFQKMKFKFDICKSSVEVYNCIKSRILKDV